MAKICITTDCVCDLPDAMLKKYDIDVDKPTVLYVGRVDPEKQVGTSHYHDLIIILYCKNCRRTFKFVKSFGYVHNNPLLIV